MKEQHGEFVREIEYTAGDASFRFLLHGQAGIVQFVMYTAWDLSADRTQRDHEVCKLFPMASDLGYHWPTPQYDGQSRLECTYMPSGYCYYDGSSLNAQPVMAAFISKGEEAVWSMLEARYKGMVEA